MTSPDSKLFDEFGLGIAHLLPDPVLVWERGATTVALNAACATFLGRTPVVTTAALCEAIHPDDWPTVRAAWARAESCGGSFTAEFRLHAASGRYCHVRARAVASHVGEKVLYIGTLFDCDDMYVAREREALLVAANAAFSDHDGPDELIDALLAIIVPRYADYAVVDLFSEDGRFEQFVFAGPDDVRTVIEAARGRYARDGAPVGSSWHVAATGESLFVSSGSLPAGWPEQTKHLHRHLGVNSAIVVPLAGNSRCLGALSVARCDPARDQFRAPSVAFYNDIAARLATVLDRARAIIALTRSEAVYRTLADEMPQLVGLTRPDGTVFFLNRLHEAYTGVASTAGGTLDWAAHVHPEDLAGLAEEWQRAISTGAGFETRYRLRRSDGTYRWFLNQAVPVRDSAGAIASWIGTATDIDEHHRREKALQLAVEAGEIFASTLDTGVALQQLADTAARHLADWCAVYLFDAAGNLKPVAVAHVDREKVKLVREYQRRYPIDQSDGVAIVATSGIPQRVGPILDEMYDVIEDSGRRAFAKSLNLRAIMNVPLAAGKTTFGAFSLASERSGRVFDDDDERVATMLAQRAGIALENARLFERQRDVARTLQSAFLPASLPALEGVGLDAAYIPSSQDISIGGDWYDADVHADGRLTLSIGDVAGHGLDSAIPMGKMRQTFRSLPAFVDDPAAASIVADTILRREHPDVFVTAFLGVYDPATRDLRYVNAGHPAPFVRRADGTIARLESAGVPLGLAAFDPPRERHFRLEQTSLLVAFTDGLIEIDRDIAAGEHQLACALAHPAFEISSTPAALIRALLVRNEPKDDIAILTVRAGGGADWTFDANDVDAAQKTRQQLVARVRTWDATEAAIYACEIIVGEVIGNAVRYAPGIVDVAVARSASGIVVRRPADLSESGRGLFLISALSCRVRCEYLTAFGTYLEVEIEMGRS
jgi:PAS domain S-box-containing protein